MVIYTRGFQAELRTEEDVWVLYFFPVLGRLFHRKEALTFLLRADLQQWSVNYGDLYVGFLTEILSAFVTSTSITSVDVYK